MPGRIEYVPPTSGTIEELVAQHPMVKSAPLLKNLGHRAVGCHLDGIKNKYELVTVAYNSVTKEAVVETVQEVAGFRRDAVIEFKKAASALNFV